MSDVTQILNALQNGDPEAAEKLLPLVYEELRRLAAAKLAQERPGQTLQPTALVHEAYLRLVQGDGDPHWNGRAHFFGAAAEAMRRVLVESARKKFSLKRGGQLQRQDADLEAIGSALDSAVQSEHMLQIDCAVEALEKVNPDIAKLVKMRYFLGLSMEECAATLNVSTRTAHRQWAYAKAFLRAQIEEDNRR